MSATKAVVVTGASGAIGSDVCRMLSDDGYAIIAHYCSAPDAVANLAESIRNKGGFCVPAQADLTEADGVDTLVQIVLETLQLNPNWTLWGLVNNAAQLLGPSLENAAPEQFDSFFSINVKAPFFLTQRLTPQMPPGGSIVNISSASAHFSSPGDIIYAMTKSTLESFTKNAAEALALRGLRVNAVVPGFTDNGHPAFSHPEIRDYMASFAVLGDVAQPIHVAEAVRFLISERSGRSTGITLDVSGGSTLGGRGSRAPSVRTLISNLTAPITGTSSRNTSSSRSSSREPTKEQWRHSKNE